MSGFPPLKRVILSSVAFQPCAFAAKLGRALLLHCWLCDDLQEWVPHILCTWGREAMAVGRCRSFLFLLVSCFLPSIGPFPNGLLKTQSVLAGVLASLKPMPNLPLTAGPLPNSSNDFAVLFMGMFWWVFPGNAWAVRSFPLLWAGSWLQAELVIRQHFISFSTISLLIGQKQDSALQDFLEAWASLFNFPYAPCMRLPCAVLPAMQLHVHQKANENGRKTLREMDFQSTKYWKLL